MSNLVASTVRNMLFVPGSHAVYAVVDGDRCSELLQAVARDRVSSECLFGGQLAPDSWRRAPHLVCLDPGSPFTEFLLAGWGRSWCIYAVAGVPLRALRNHFRSLLMVSDPSGNPLFFRFFDPRVFGVYLPSVNEQEADYIFGPVDFYLFEEEDTGAILRFSRGKGRLKVDRFDSSALSIQDSAPPNTHAATSPRTI